MSVNMGNAVAYLDLDASKFTAGLSKIGKDFNQFMDKTESAGTRITALGNGFKNIGSSMAKNITLPLAAIGTASTVTAANFESSMLQVAATMGMTAEEIENGSESFTKLENAAKEMGSTTQYSASQSAEALNYMALAGYDVDTAISTLPKVLNLAAAGGMELAAASDMVTDGLSALGMGAEDADRFVDVLAKTSQKSNTSVSQLGEALLTVGGTAKNLSGGLEEASTVIGIFSDNGIKGSEAGTALRNTILALTPTTDDAVAAFEKLGVETYDANGNLKPLNETFGELDSALSTLSQEERTRVLSDIFNKVDLKAVNALLANSGDRFNELSGYIGNASGAASDMAETMNSGLNGQLTLLKSGLEGAGIAIGEALLPLIEKLVEWINNAVTWFNELDPSVQTNIATIGLLVAAIGPLLLIGGSLISSIGTIITAFSGLGGVVTSVTGFFGMFGSSAVGVAGPMAVAGAGATALGGILTGGLIFALVGVIAKIGDSETALGWLQDKFGSLGTVIGAVCEFISGIWDFTIGNIIEVGKAGFDVLAAIIDGPGGATVKDAMGNFTKALEKNNSEAWDKITIKTTRELSQQKNSVDKETKDAKGKADKNTKDMANAMNENTKKGADDVAKNMEATSKIVMDETGKIPQDVQSNMDQSVQAMRQAGSDIYNGMNTSFSKLASQGKQHFTDLYLGVTNSTNKMANEVISDWNRIRSALSSKITGTVEIRQVTTSANNGGSDSSRMYNEVSRLVNSERLAYNNDAMVQRLSSNDTDKDIVKDKSNGKSITINNTYNSPKPASIRELKKQDEIQMRRLAMQF